MDAAASTASGVLILVNGPADAPARRARRDASRVGAAAALLPDEMLVDYHGAWDEDYFARLAARIDELPERRALAERGERLRAVAEPFSYPRLVETVRTHVFAAG